MVEMNTRAIPSAPKTSSLVYSCFLIVPPLFCIIKENCIEIKRQNRNKKEGQLWYTECGDDDEKI